MSGLTSKALRSYVPLMQEEVQAFIQSSPHFGGTGGVATILPLMSQINLCAATRALQGKEIRDKLDGTVSSLYHALKEGLSSINLFAPWLPLPHK